MRAEALSQVLPFVSCSRPRVQNAALWSLERIAEDHTSGRREGGREGGSEFVCVCVFFVRTHVQVGPTIYTSAAAAAAAGGTGGLVCVFLLRGSFAENVVAAHSSVAHCEA